MTELLDDGTLTRSAHATTLARRDIAGRRPAMFAVTPPHGYAVAIDFGHERIQVTVCDLGGRVIGRGMRLVGVATDARTCAAGARDVLADIVERAGIGGLRRAGVVAAIPEPIDLEGRVARDNIDSRWHGVRPSQVLADVIGGPVHAENDANLAVLGESIFGSARAMDDVIYIKVSHGVGLGLLTNGRLVRGTSGLAGEIGHMQVRSDGAVCRCGKRGCLYTLCASEFLTPYLHAVTRNRELTLDNLAGMGRQGDPGAGRLLRDAGSEVGAALAPLCNALNPRAVIVGGSLARAGTWVIDGIRETLGDRIEDRVAASLNVTTGTLGERAETYGAVSMAIGVIDPRSGAPRPAARSVSPAG